MFDGYLNIKELIVLCECLNIILFLFLGFMITRTRRTTTIFNNPQAKAVSGDDNHVDTNTPYEEDR